LAASVLGCFEKLAGTRSLTFQQINGAVKRNLDPDKMYLIKAGTIPGVPAASDGK
jgi:hypothetical protein